MIKDGYLELTTHLTLYGLEGDYDADTLHLIREYADRSSIEAYTVYAYAEQGCRSAENVSLFIEVLKESKKAERVRFIMNITSRPDFKIFWDTFVAVLQIETIKKVRFDITSYSAYFPDMELIGVNPDLLIRHIDKIEVNFELKRDIDPMTYAIIANDLFTYDQSDELKISDFAKKFKGTCSIRQEYSYLVLEFMNGIMRLGMMRLAREEEDTDEGGTDNEGTDSGDADDEADEDWLRK